MLENSLTIVSAAILVEALVNTVKNIQSKNSDWRYWAALGTAILGSVLVTYNWELDLFSVLLGDGKLPYVGAILTGFIVARGSNVVSDLLKLVNTARQRLATGVQPPA
jgi:drug/metabolite transporter (DMT)-like permease